MQHCFGSDALPRLVCPDHPTPTGAIKPVITMYAVANIDSALWGTRSIGDVKFTATIAPALQTPTRWSIWTMPYPYPPSSLGSRDDGNDVVRKSVTEVSQEHLGIALVAPAVNMDEEEAVPLMRDGSDVVGSSTPAMSMERPGSGHVINDKEKNTQLKAPVGNEDKEVARNAVNCLFGHGSSSCWRCCGFLPTSVSR